MILVALLTGAFAQKGTRLEATVLNNTFTKVDLVNAYTGNQTKYATADIVGDRFSIDVTLPDDIYRLDFGNGAGLLLVLKSGENIKLLLDAENIQEIKSVTGSPSIENMRQMAGYSLRRKAILDSINQALQEDPDKKYWSSFVQDFNMFRQTNGDVDGYLEKVFSYVDTMDLIFKTYMPNGKLSGKNARVCADELNKCLKKAEISYSPFASYLENVDRYYNFSDSRRTAETASFYSEFEKYMKNLRERHNLAETTIGAVMPKIKGLLQNRDSLAFNNMLNVKNTSNWVKDVFNSIGIDVNNIAGKGADYSRTVNEDAKRSDWLFTKSQENLSAVVAKYQAAFNESDAFLNAKLKEEIRKNKGDLSVLAFLDMFPREQNADLHNEVIKALHETYPENLIVKERWAAMNSPAAKTSIGSMAPELAFPNPDGKILKLSDLKGKVVLIDFWASWCGPCRKENPNVTKVYSMYHDKGFEIYSVSLDSDGNSWKRAIEQDKLVWPNHVSDLKKWQSQAAAIYGVRSIPATFLLDKEGRIVQKNLRGADLERAVKQLLGE